MIEILLAVALGTGKPPRVDPAPGARKHITRVAYDYEFQTAKPWIWKSCHVPVHGKRHCERKSALVARSWLR